MYERNLPTYLTNDLEARCEVRAVQRGGSLPMSQFSVAYSGKVKIEGEVCRD